LSWAEYIDLPGTPWHIDPYQGDTICKCDVVAHYLNSRHYQAIIDEQSMDH
jgi:hypothetical protein